MGDLIKKLLEAKRLDALESVEALQKAAKELGFSEDEVAAALDDFDGFPLDDDDMEEILGGVAPSMSMKIPNRNREIGPPLTL